MTIKHLLVDLSTHGFGHFAQMSMVLNELNRLSLPIKITLRSTLPTTIIHERLHFPMTMIHHPLDKGMVMHNAVQVDANASYHYYQQLHENYEQHVTDEVAHLRALAPDLLIADVPYLSLSAAAQLGIPSIALCSLNWAGIFQSFCADFPNASKITQDIIQAYSSAQRFLTVTPSMLMPELPNTQAIPPIAYQGNDQLKTLQAQVGDSQARFILVSLGGIPTTINPDNWPHIKGTYWIVGAGVQCNRSDVLSQTDIDLPFIDLLSSCQALVTKTGYGLLVEATINQVPVICVERGDWPEEPELFRWVAHHGYLQVVSMQALNTGELSTEINNALQIDWQKPTVAANGAQVAANIIRHTLNKAEFSYPTQEFAVECKPQ